MSPLARWAWLVGMLSLAWVLRAGAQQGGGAPKGAGNGLGEQMSCLAGASCNTSCAIKKENVGESDESRWCQCGTDSEPSCCHLISMPSRQGLRWGAEGNCLSCPQLGTCKPGGNGTAQSSSQGTCSIIGP